MQPGGTQSSLPISIFTEWTAQGWIMAALQIPAVHVFSQTPKEINFYECEAYCGVDGDILTPVIASNAITVHGSVTTSDRKPSPKAPSLSLSAVLSQFGMLRISPITTPL